MTVLASRTTTLSDSFKKPFLKSIPQEVNSGILMVTLPVALVLGLGIFMVYRKCLIGVAYGHPFNLSLAVMTVLVSVTIVAVSSNTTLSLDMVDTLSIIHYRTAMESPLDLMFTFWAITTEIAVGAHYYYIVLFSFLLVALMFFLLKRWKGEVNIYVVIVNYASQLECEESVCRVSKDYKNTVKSKIMKHDSTELTVETFLKHESPDLFLAVEDIEGANDVTLV